MSAAGTLAPVTAYGATRRVGWAVPGLAAGWAAVVLGSPWLLLAWIVPDLGVLAGGIRVVDERGRLTRGAAIGYNTTHALVGPVLLSLGATALAAPLVWAVVALWVCHIGVDRALGYTLKPVPPRA